MKKVLVIAIALAVGSVLLPAEAAAPATAANSFADKIERLAEKMLPQKTLNEAMGFFGPVTKKYLPVFERFNAEYLSSTNKLATVKKYLPKANAAVSEAKAMKIPAKYEAKKAEYINMVESFLSVVNFTTRFSAD